MVGALLLLKMLHCKRKCRGSKTEEIKMTKTLSAPTQGQKYDTNLCRVCLKEGDVPIYGSDINIDDIAEALVTFGGIELNKNDDLPKMLCEPCHALLQGAVVFRRTAQESDQLLKQSLEELNQKSDNEFEYSGESNQFHYDIKYDCKRCDIEFSTYQEYHNHKISDEHENKRVTCSICNKNYTATYYKKHVFIHKADCPYVCDICGKKFIMQGQFTRHRVTHFYKLPFKCDHCPYRGRFRESLKMHMRSHTGEKPYQCSECAARFVSKSNLNKHMNIHKKEYDFKCEICGHGCYSKKKLEMHIKVDHTGIKDHKCNICGKEFGYRKQMMKHQLKVHKRQKLRSGRLPLYLQVEELGKDADTGH